MRFFLFIFEAIRRYILKLILLVHYGFYFYQMLLIVYALLSWFPGARTSGLGHLVERLVSPYLSIFDRLIPSIGGISFNVIIALLVLQLIERGLLTLLQFIL